MINLTQGRRLQARDLQHTLKSFNTLKTGSAAEARDKGRAAGQAAGHAWLLLTDSKGSAFTSVPAPGSHPLIEHPRIHSLSRGCSPWLCSQRGFGGWGDLGSIELQPLPLAAGDRDCLEGAFASLAQPYR